MIPADYDTMLDLARKLHYKSLTQLQETAFRTRSLYDEQKNIMVIGPTSSGKTLIPLLLYAAAVKKAMDAAEPLPRMLFIVPYRALASQKCHELKSTLRTLLGLDLSIAQSTGELRQSDNDIRNGRPTVSVVINEKAFLFARENAGFLSGYRYIVMDEIGLLADQNRGIKLDFLLSWAIAARPKPRMIALATPFYDWSVYAEHFGFERIISQERPTLLKCPVFFSGNGNSRQVDTFDWPDSCTGFGSFSIYRKGKSTASLCSACEELCPLDTPCRQDLTLPCPHTQQPCLRPVELLDPGKPFRFQLIADLCRWHLRQSHQVLIFWNDRENCRQLALYLFHELADMLREPPPLEECRQVVLQACTEISNEESGLRRTELISEDEMFGILEPEHYRALCAGVGFHSSAVPLELRSFVERRFLDSRELSIVCATETLAFGIHRRRHCGRHEQEPGWGQAVSGAKHLFQLYRALRTSAARQAHGSDRRLGTPDPQRLQPEKQELRPLRHRLGIQKVAFAGRKAEAARGHQQRSFSGQREKPSLLAVVFAGERCENQIRDDPMAVQPSRPGRRRAV